ncbi:hypothetical protein QFZ77_003228 [Paenibacillus sp. V4I3]|uniref:class I SAM-dependent methyltransferase n=1 Tax=unclassified Paenibacillus TaxID=185978 RepID=UPI00278677EA|nr:MULTISPECIES: class I SAM-dependent methyltransferase [unclassified Paenibacillus]MDQ0874569.1 hypothetical protein [Paenibacillus sp. V4I3]MDQ0889679.1 hypothetical protein [Paenibacillus sp. V4I9]
MKRFWDPLIQPIFNMIRPKVIVEIGCADGLNTANLLRYCEATDSKLICIDPAPMFNVQKANEAYGDRFEFIRDLSLTALKTIKHCDVVLIDGDHNWYTVFHELKMIDAMERFPLVFEHDIEWPYGRRDMYYNPASIPEAYRKPYSSLGVLPGVKEVVPGGVNHRHNNALYEHGEKNGVLTAIEDFLADTKRNIQLHRVSSHFGLGVLLEVATEADELLNKRIAKLIHNSKL